MTGLLRKETAKGRDAAHLAEVIEVYLPKPLTRAGVEAIGEHDHQEPISPASTPTGVE